MTSKLQRAVDATLEKYDGYLSEALDEDLWGDGLDEGSSCAFCQEFMPPKYRSSFLSDSGFPRCTFCPIGQIEPGRLFCTAHCFGPVLKPIIDTVYAGHAVPAILAAMIYLHGFVEE
jgi:hypothetical protein